MMRSTQVTLASLRSVLIDPQWNLDQVRGAAAQAHADGARLLVLPELMLTGHGAHQKMTENAEPVPDGPLSQAVLEMSADLDLCICVGVAELADRVVYNSQIVVDRGEYLGLQRKMNLSGDEYCHFGAGDQVEVFDIGDLRFGITICYDNLFPELALLHSLHKVDLVLAPHAARTGEWPQDWTPEFCSRIIKQQQDSWEKVHRARAYDHNVYVLLCNAVGPSTRELEGVVANHAGTVMGVAPDGEVFLRSSASTFEDEIVTVTLDANARIVNHGPTRNRRPDTLMRLLRESIGRDLACALRRG
jgi:predicted amidohydrolase